MKENILVLGLLLLVFIKLLLFRFKPRKSSELYEIKLAHRGFHMLYPENTREAYESAIDANMGIELDVRFLRDNSLVCFHDRYTKRLLGIPGKISMLDINMLNKFHIKDSKCKVPTLIEVLEQVNGRTPLLIEVKGSIDKNQLEIINRIILTYPYQSTIYFHVKNVKTYFYLKHIFNNKVFYILNPFRKRLRFLKGEDYKSHTSKYYELFNDMNIEIPTPEDIGQIITQRIQEVETKKEILASIGEIINQYETRVDKNHWVNNSLWLHRGIISDKYLEHSKESFLACIDFAKKNNIKVTVEFDIVMYKGEARCYHNDKIPKILGQDKSCAEKLKFDKSLKLLEILNIFAGYEEYINLAIDIKDYHLFNHELPNLIIKNIEESRFRGDFILMSYNPFVLNYLKDIRSNYLRAQIGHSLSGLRRVPFFRFPWLLNGILGVLFDIGHADCILFDDSEWIFWMIAYHKNIKGKSVLVYAPKNFMEIEAFIGKESISNFIIENAESRESWPEEYVNKFKTVV